MTAAEEEQQRLLNTWNARRAGWAAFQRGTRRAAERLAKKPLPEETA